MAAVAVGNTTGWGAPGYGPRCGPYEDGNGDLWLVVMAEASNGSNNFTPAVVKSTDGGATWGTPNRNTGQGSTVADGYGTFDSVFDVANEIIYVVFCSGPAANASLWKFTLSSTTWANVVTSGTPPAPRQDVSTNHAPLFLMLRSTGEFVVFYQGPTHSLMGNPYRTAYYARCSAAGVWSAGVEVSGAVKLIHYDAKYAVLGASDRSHFFYTDGQNLIHRSLSSTNAFGETPGASTGVAGGNNQAYHSAIYDTTLAKIITGPTYLGRASSQAGPTWSYDTNSVGNTDSTAAPVVTIYEPSGGKLYAFFAEAATHDLYQNSSATTTWVTADDTEVDVATAIQGISIGLITDAIGVVFNDNGTVYFDKLVLTAPPEPIPPVTANDEFFSFL